MTNQNTEQFHPPLEQRADDLTKMSDFFSEFMRIQRATQRDGRPETNGEHTIHEMFIAVVYAAKYHPNLDPGKIALFMLFHDTDEVHVGDVNSLTADSAALEQKKRNEAVSREYLRRLFAEDPFVLDIMERYWAMEEPEAKFVWSIEKTGPSFAHQSDGGDAIRTMGISSRDQYQALDARAIERMAGRAPADILGLRRILGERVMRVAFDTV